jgi:hypothetical protein
LTKQRERAHAQPDPCKPKLGIIQGESRDEISVVSRDTTGKNSGNSPVSQKQEKEETT